jgi:hypothetical protein
MIHHDDATNLPSILFEQGEAWAKFTRTADGSVDVDSFLEVTLSPDDLAMLSAWLSEPTRGPEAATNA